MSVLAPPRNLKPATPTTVKNSNLSMMEARDKDSLRNKYEYIPPPLYYNSSLLGTRLTRDNHNVGGSVSVLPFFPSSRVDNKKESSGDIKKEGNLKGGSDLADKKGATHSDTNGIITAEKRMTSDIKSETVEKKDDGKVVSDNRKIVSDNKAPGNNIKGSGKASVQKAQNKSVQKASNGKTNDIASKIINETIAKQEQKNTRTNQTAKTKKSVEAHINDTAMTNDKRHFAPVSSFQSILISRTSQLSSLREEDENINEHLNNNEVGISQINNGATSAIITKDIVDIHGATTSAITKDAKEYKEPQQVLFHGATSAITRTSKNEQKSGTQKKNLTNLEMTPEVTPRMIRSGGNILGMISFYVQSYDISDILGTRKTIVSSSLI